MSPLKASVVINPSAVYLQIDIQTDLTWLARLKMKQTWRGMKQTRLTERSSTTLIHNEEQDNDMAN